MAAPSVQAVGTEVAAGSASDLVVSWPAHQADDIGVLIVSGVYGSANNYSASGWTEFPDSPQSNSSDPLNARLQVFWRRATSGAEADATVSDVAGDDSKIGVIVTIRGCVASGNPFDVTAGDNTDTNSTSVSIPGDTTTGADRLILAIVGHAWIDSASAQASGWTNGDLTSVTEVVDVCTTSSIGYGIAAASGVKAAAGAYGATTATLAGSAAQGQGRISIAFVPPSTIPFTPPSGGRPPFRNIRQALVPRSYTPYQDPPIVFPQRGVPRPQYPTRTPRSRLFAPVTTPAVNAPTPLEGTTLAALTSGSLSVKYVVAIEGYPYLLTDATPQQAIDAWYDARLTNQYTQALGGLYVEMQQEQELDPWNPFTGGGRCTFRVVQTTADDTFGVDTHRRPLTGTDVTRLTSTVDRDDTTINVASTFGFDDSGDAWIGNECFGYQSKTPTSFLYCQRGKYAALNCDVEGVAVGVGLSGYHRVGAAAQINEVDLKPLVTAFPRVWIGKWVSVYLHKYSEETGTLNSKDDALCVFAGRIVSISDDGSDNATVVELKSALDVVADATVGGRDVWSGKIRNVVDIVAGMTFKMRDRQTPTGGAHVHEYANDLVVVSGGASGANQMNAGYYTQDELFVVLNTWWASETAAGRLHGSYSIGRWLPDDGSVSTYIYWQHGAASTTQVRFEFALPYYVAKYLGYDSDGTPSPSVVNGFSMSQVISDNKDGDGIYSEVSDRPMRRAVFTGFGGYNNNAFIDDAQGTFVDQYDYLPSSAKPPTSGGNEWGVFLVDNRLLVLGWYDGLQIQQIQVMPQQYGLTPDDYGDVFGDISLPLTANGPQDTDIKQVFALEMPLGSAIKSFMKSTGSTTYNDNLWDRLAYGLGIAIPHSICGDEFDTSVDAIPHADKPIVIVIDKPIRFADLFHGDLVLRRSYLRWKQGHLEFTYWRTPSAEDSVATLSEANKAAPASAVDHGRSLSMENGAWARPIVKVRYNRTVSTDSDTYRDSYTIVDGTAIDDAGGEGATLTINARNTYGEHQQTGIGIEELLPGFVASMPLFSNPSRVISRSIDQRYFEQIAPGDIITISDAYARDPDTGQRTVATRYGIVIKSWWTLGGATPGSDQANPQGGGVDVFLMDLQRAGAYVPSAQVDSGAANGGYNAGTKVLTLKAQQYGGSANDVTYFAAGDKVRVLQRDPADATAPLSWDDTISSVAGDTVTLTTGLAGWDSGLNYMLLFDSYGDAVASQQVYAYQADDADGMIENTRAAMVYALGTVNTNYTAWSASDEIELSPNMTYGDGAPYDVGTDWALMRLVNNLNDYKTANSAPLLYTTELGAEAWGSGTYRLEACEPIHLSRELLLNDIWRRLVVAPFMKSSDGLNASVRVSLCRTPPVNDTDLYDVNRGTVYSEATFTTASTTYAQMASDSLVCNIKDADGNAWLYIEVTSNARTYGLGICQEGPRLY